MAFDDGAAGVVSIVRAITGIRSHRTGHLIEQWPDLRALIDIIRRQLRRNDLAGVGVNANMELPPGAPST
jgi:hypothetical protein